LLPEQIHWNSGKRASLLQLPHQAAGAPRGLGLAQQVNVRRHQNPAKQQKARFLPKLWQNLQEVGAEAVTLEELPRTLEAKNLEVRNSV
jgi:hypothetical protein